MNLRRKFFIFTVLPLFFSLNAQTVYYVSPKGNDGNDGKSWATAKREVQSAIDAAATGDQVWVASGIYYPTRFISGLENDERGKAFILAGGIGLFGGFAGTETDLSQRAPADSTAVDFNGPWNFKCPTVLSADYDDGADSWWGSSVNDQWAVAYTYGNGYHVIWNEKKNQDSSRETVIDGFIISGGNADHPELPAHRQGGGICGGEGWIIRNCIIRENAAYNYGGLVNEGTVTHSYITRNRALQSAGGVYNSASGEIGDCVIAGNSAQFDGGGIENYGKMKNCSVNGNFANFDGGGVYNYGYAENCLFFSNAVRGNGGGVYNYGMLVNCTIARNAASYAGGGLVNHTEGEAVNCIVWDNRTGGSGTFGFTAFTDTVAEGEGNIEIDLRTVHFVIPSFFTGLSCVSESVARLAGTDWRLVKGSECIDAGTAAYGSIVIPDTDMKGFARPWGEGYDMGAYEYDGTTLSDLEEPVKENPYRIYPNPFVSYLSVGGLTPSDRRVSVYSLTGHLVSQLPVTGNEIVFPTSSWLPGTYFVRIEGEEDICTRKVIRRP